MGALAVPTIAAFGSWLAYLNYRLARLRREDDLFDRRYAFFRKMVDAWQYYAKNELDIGQAVPDWDDRLVWAGEARLLFGSDIADHIKDYDDSFDPNFYYIPNESFVEPFYRYLRLGKPTFLPNFSQGYNVFTMSRKKRS